MIPIETFITLRHARRFAHHPDHGPFDIVDAFRPLLSAVWADCVASVGDEKEAAIRVMDSAEKRAQNARTK